MNESLDDGRGAVLAVRRQSPAGEPRGELVYLHGFRSSQAGEKAGYFRERVTALGWRFVSFDATGHGDSEGDLPTTTLSRNLEDLDRVLNWLGPPAKGVPRVLFGSSLGGAAALWFAARRPEAVAGVATIAPAVDIPSFLLGALGREGVEAWRETGSRRLEDDLGVMDLPWGFVDDLGAYDPASLAARLEIPVLVFQGRRDLAVGWRGAVELATHAPQGWVDLYFFGAGDHRLLDYRPLMWRHVEDFLERRIVPD